ncbi:DUF4157 domain-containing protein [Okeania sp. KiyG1]|uniref:eCIS core domain-containing protein n=1 Tax=Okeania sp. KiyG1 TaxID=2720165 RepID=UPI0019204BF4|nr:DUF4157 domain-containing protein [Okeania sp. KiyG1]GGA02154.1 hypothetical protein CYANOKiyG1_14130 [Okeania sp. KiyG1]
MYQKPIAKKTSPSLYSIPINKKTIPTPSYGSLSGTIQRAVANPESLSREEWLGLDSSIGTRATEEIKSGKRTSYVPEFQGISAQLEGDSGGVREPIQTKGQDDVGVSEVQHENNTGLPDNLKAGVENLSGYSLDDVRVNYNSPKPSQLQALAYTQGTEIHVAPGQEKHLPHEAWHVVQQAQGRVKPTMQMKQGVDINNDPRLEQEANLMGEKAVQKKSQSETHNMNNLTLSTRIPIQKESAQKVAQLVLATVKPQNGPITLSQAGGNQGRFVIMQNPGQIEGNEVSNDVGFTDVLNPEGWAGLAISPANYWRAHAYAKSFGGAGNDKNVGWWTKGAEDDWTKNEQNVRGAGVDQINEWKPGIGEIGNYKVTRELHPSVEFKPNYVDGLMKAISWGFDDSRDAWTRVINTNTKKAKNEKEKQLRLNTLNEKKQSLLGTAKTKIEAWVGRLFGESNLESNLIKKMTMKYDITNNGQNAGGSRKSFTYHRSSVLPKKHQFGLENKPKEIWEKLVNHNEGLFAQANPPISEMTVRVPYYDYNQKTPGDHAKETAQELRPYADGWGAEKK